MANEERLDILKQSIKVWNQWREENSEIRPDLSRAVLREADLREADLREADLRRAVLRFADLSRAVLRGADLRGAVLRGADLSRADLSRAVLSSADLRGAVLREAVLRGAVLRFADLRSAVLREAVLAQADLTGIIVGWTVFADVDLSEAVGLETVKHEGPSTIGIDTIYKSKGNIPYKFLLDAGVTKDDIHYLLSLAGKAIDFYSCFISYASQDKPFAERLHADLQAKGIRTWYAPKDLKIGQPYLLGIDEGIKLYDKFLVVLSEHSINSGWVQQEVLWALDKEQGQAPWVLFPVRLDDTVLNTSAPWAKLIKPRHIGDFTQWKDHDAYQVALAQLLRDLQTQAA